MCLHVWSPVGGNVLRGYGNLRRWSLRGRTLGGVQYSLIGATDQIIGLEPEVRWPKAASKPRCGQVSHLLASHRYKSNSVKLRQDKKVACKTVIVEELQN